MRLASILIPLCITGSMGCGKSSTATSPSAATAPSTLALTASGTTLLAGTWAPACSGPQMAVLLGRRPRDSLPT
jgi:hypothetical protein